jgi:hypothetical protein
VLARERAPMRFLEFFAANIRNPHTRRVSGFVAEDFLAWCAIAGVPSIAARQPVHVWIEAVDARASQSSARSSADLAFPTWKGSATSWRRRHRDTIMILAIALPSNYTV